MCFISTQRYLPMKKFIFKEQPFDRGIFIQGISQAGQKITGNYKPATAEEINKFETELNCSLPDDYKNFLLSINGGTIDPAKIDKTSAAIDIKQTVNGNDWASEPVITVSFLYTLDESTLLERDKNENTRRSLTRSFHLPVVNSRYYDDYANTEEAMGLANKNLVIIASSDDHYIALSCDDDLYGKVLAIDSGVYPEDYPPGVAKTMANVAILADSFDNFLQSIFYYQR